MIDILIFIRFKQFLAHTMHHFTYGPEFFADHEFFSEVYTQAESQFDSLAERMIGLDIRFDPVDVSVKASALLKEIPFPYKDEFELLKTAEVELIGEIDKFIRAGKVSQGTIQLLGDFCNQSEVNLYKINQRLKT